ncbi:MAG: hypothetical protein ACRD63_06565 [Pyrinomonadaceae bacterium]
MKLSRTVLLIVISGLVTAPAFAAEAAAKPATMPAAAPAAKDKPTKPVHASEAKTHKMHHHSAMGKTPAAGVKAS